MPASLSNDLRERIVAAYHQKQGTQEELAQQFHVSISSVKRYLKSYRDHNHVNPKPHGGVHPLRINEFGRLWLQELLRDQSDLYLKEIQQLYADQFHDTVPISTLARTLSEEGIVLKKDHLRSTKVPGKELVKNL